MDPAETPTAPPAVCPAKRIGKRTALVWLLSCGLAAAQVPTAYPEIEYASPEQSVWTTRTDSQGQPENPLFRVADALFAQAGIRWHGRSYPAARMFKYLQDGKAQFSILINAPALQDCCLLSRKPVAYAEIRVYHLADKAPVKTIEALAGKALITVHGYSYGGLLRVIDDERSRIAHSAAPTHGAAFKMLAHGRADYVIDYAGPAAEIQAAEPVIGLRSELLSRQGVFLVLSKGYPDAANVMARLEGIAATLDIDRLMRAPASPSTP